MFLRDKRARPRKAIQTNGWVTDLAENDTWHIIRLLDISTDGFAFISQEKIKVSSRHYFRFQLPGSSRMMQFDGWIAYCMEHPYLAGYRVGVQFDNIDATDLTMIEWFINREKATSS